jgi:hypothetical protein
MTSRLMNDTHTKKRNEKRRKERRMCLSLVCKDAFSLLEAQVARKRERERELSPTQV